MTYAPAVPVESATYRHYAVSTINLIGAAVRPAALASVAWPLANLALYVPIYFNEACTVYEAGVGAGATAGGNFDLGLYQLDGTKIVSSGTTARTASAWNTAGLTDTVVFPGWYYAAMSADSTANYSGLNPAAGLCESLGIVEQATAFVLPSPATISTRTTRAILPSITFAVRSVAL